MSGMPPVPCPDCLTPTEYVNDVFRCPKDGQVFTTPFGLDMSMAQELWTAWTATPPAGDIEQTPALPDEPKQWTLEELTMTPEDRERFEVRGALMVAITTEVPDLASWEAEACADRILSEWLPRWLAGRTVLELPERITVPPCTHTDADSCACPDLPACCSACGNMIAVRDDVFLLRQTAHAWMSADHPQQELVEYIWHAYCDLRLAYESSGSEAVKSGD